MKFSKLNLIIFSFIVLIMFPRSSFSWFNDPEINTPVAPGTNNQLEPSAITDGVGGTIVAWSEKDSDTGEFDIYAQRLNSQGVEMWASPVALCTAVGDQGGPGMVSDSFGGAIVVWGDPREVSNGHPGELDIYGQRINGDGDILWANNGVPISTAPGLQTNQVVAPDGLGGAYIAWDDNRDGSHVYAQRINQNGVPVWQLNGIVILDSAAQEGPPGSFFQVTPNIADDGLGNVFIVWTDYQPSSISNIFGQKLDSDGNKLWGLNALALCTEVGVQFDAYVTNDGLGGAIFTWTDGRSGNDNLDIYAQKVDSNGNTLWQSDGIPVINFQGNQIVSSIVGDGVGGAIVAWGDTRKQNGDVDVYAQRISDQGVQIWNTDGIPVASTAEAQNNPALIPDGSGGAYITWQDFFRGGRLWNIYAQHIDGNGQAKWLADGIAVSTPDETQSNPLILSDGSGGFISIWTDSRFKTYTNIFAQQVDNRGILGGGKFWAYTADREGDPTKVFTPDNLIQFTTTWTEPAPLTPGTYQAESVMIIHNNTDFRHNSISYDVVP